MQYLGSSWECPETGGCQEEPIGDAVFWVYLEGRANRTQEELGVDVGRRVGKVGPPEHLADGISTL